MITDETQAFDKVLPRLDQIIADQGGEPTRADTGARAGGLGLGYLAPRRFATNPRPVPYAVLPLTVIGLNMIVATLPLVPKPVVRAVAGRYLANFTSFDAGRGCPFKCSFCTIINVQGRTSRWRDADDVEKIVRANLAQGIHRYFVTDDNFARNRNWEAIFDRLAKLRAEGVKISLTLQVDTMCHKIAGFIEKARAAGTRRVRS